MKSKSITNYKIVQKFSLELLLLLYFVLFCYNYVQGWDPILYGSIWGGFFSSVTLFCMVLNSKIQFCMFMFYVFLFYGVILYDYVKTIYKFEMVLIIH